MTQPNFLQVARSLRLAVDFCEANAGLSSSKLYVDVLRERRDFFASATKATDTSYTAWRVALGEELRAFRNLKIAYDNVTALADEHAMDSCPVRPIVYTDRAPLVRLVEETTAWLESNIGEWDWIEEEFTKLTQMMKEAGELRAVSEEKYGDYCLAVKDRVQAYDLGVSLVREYVSDAKSEAKGDKEFAQVSLDLI